ncbi:unnamed protein product [Symbiodinium natans]|uniref:Uncharacterized protein n=1 Tax=Symbiodinium natans TaxID=878477 RepID=A0A812RC06_9DINO|nr:unnamed protein product [Symbiodinium natans]
MAFAVLQAMRHLVSITVIVLTALTFNMFRGSQSPTWWGRYLVYPATYVLAVQVGATHMLPMLIVGTLLRYAVNLLFTALSKLDTFAEPVRIHRTNPPAEQHERELDSGLLDGLRAVLCCALTTAHMLMLDTGSACIVCLCQDWDGPVILSPTAFVLAGQPGSAAPTRIPTCR